MKNQSNSNTDPIYYQEATTLAKLIRHKEISSVEVVQAHLDRITEVNPKINGIVTLMGEQALISAALADKAVSKGEELGPLHGVPFSIKDAIDTAGIPTKRGSKIFEDFIPEKDATAVIRMKDAGGIPLLKSNIPEFSTFLESDNLVTGRSNNPWNPDHTLARTVRDVALGYSIINGADGIDGYSIFAKNAGPATFRLPGEKIRVGWMSSAAFQLSLYHSV